MDAVMGATLAHGGRSPERAPGGALPGFMELRRSSARLRRRRRRLLLRRRHAEWLMAGPARLASEILRDRLGGGQGLGARGITELVSLRAQVLGRRLELGPLLPSLPARPPL